MNIIAQCCGIVIMVIIIYFYSSQKKLELYTSRAFLTIWHVVMITLLLDILSLYAICHMDTLPMMLVNLICKLYLCGILWEAATALWYICVDIFSAGEKEKRVGRWLITVSIIINVLVLVMPISIVTGEDFAYTTGVSVTITYAAVFPTLVGMLYMTNHYKDIMNDNRRRGVRAWIAIWVCAAATQFLVRSLLIVGYAAVIGILIIYLLLENPMSNIDKDTGLFNLNAFFQYMKELQGRKTNVSIVCARYDNNSSAVSFKNENGIAAEVVDFMENLPHAIVFRSSASEFILVFENGDYASTALRCIQQRFEKPWGVESMHMLPYEVYYMESTAEVKSSLDILGIFQYARQSRATFTSREVMEITNEVINIIYDEKNIENEIIDALNENRIEVFYQPIYATERSSFTTAEALVRMRDRDGSIVPPAKFIDVAEKRGLIIRLGERVFEKVCQFIVGEHIEQMGLDYIEINLSVIQCAYENLADDFITIMDEYRVDPKRIVLEITESASTLEKKILLSNMEKLRNVGVKFALDDFGTGQSNLNYIVDMPVDIIKFDKTMTDAYFTNSKGKHVMNAAMGMIKNLDLDIVSEGIEREEQFTKLDDIGIDFIQGYYFSKPIEKEQFVEFLKENNTVDLVPTV